MRAALVVTVVHHPEDARIRHRQIEALLDAGWLVTYAAPWTGYALAPRPRAGLSTTGLPRAHGHRRAAALLAARRLLRTEASHHDLVVLHDPELLLATWGLDLPPVVWDVHEDTAASVGMKPWLPRPLARPTARAVRGLEWLAERRVHLLLAEDAYQERFRRRHPVVPNTTRVPAEAPAVDGQRLVYVGHLTRARGAVELVRLGALLHERTGGEWRVQLVGAADAETERLLAGETPGVEWLGFLPHAEAMAVVDGAFAGLSLLHDEPNYRVSRPTKVIEYLAHGVPVLTTALPEAERLVERTRAGVVVPFVDGRCDPRWVAEAVLDLARDPARRHAMAQRGHAYAAEWLDWNQHAEPFVARLESLAF